MEGLVGIWRKLVVVTVLWATGSFLLSQGVAWETFKSIDSRNEALVCLWGITVVGILAIATFLLAASYAGHCADRPRLARLPPIEKDLDLTAGQRAFNAIQWTVIIGTVVWPLYCEAHFLDKIARVPIYPCISRPTPGPCQPDYRDAAVASQWHPQWPMRIYRFGVGTNSQGVDFIPLLEPTLYIAIAIGAFGAAGFLGFRLMRPTIAAGGQPESRSREEATVAACGEESAESKGDPHMSTSEVSMQISIAKYKQLGYVPIDRNTSRIGSEVLHHPAQRKVVKFGQDAAYDVFVTHAMQFRSEHYPQFYKHERPAGLFSAVSNRAFTLTEMEVLVPLDSEEESKVSAWVTAVFDARRNHSDPAQVPDPYGLTNDLLRLIQIAVANSVNIDLLKPTNYMVRETPNGRQIVFTDPYN